MRLATLLGDGEIPKQAHLEIFSEAIHSSREGDSKLSLGDIRLASWEQGHN